MSYKRYYFKDIIGCDGYYSDVKLWDRKTDSHVIYLHGDVLDFLNRIEELEIENAKLKSAFAIEQNAGMELARKLLNK